MRRVLAAVGCVGIALLASACDQLDKQYFREGIGTELYAPDIAEVTRLQDIYLSELCRQSMPVVASGDVPACGSATLGPIAWTLIVQSGMNDIDRRCDAYLAWLDDRKRTNPAIIKQLGDMSAAAQSIMRLGGVGADPITIVGIAFGLATNTFTNINSRLLLEVDKTTVQSLVLSRRNDYRIRIMDIRINNRAAAVHALRSYLSICTPFTIETTINTAVAIYEQGGRKANEKPLIDADTVVAATIITDVNKPLSRPVTAPLNTTDPDLVGDDEKRQQPKQINTLRTFACKAPVGQLGEVRKILLNYLETHDGKGNRIDPTKPVDPTNPKPAKDPSHADRLTNRDFIVLREQMRVGHKAC